MLSKSNTVSDTLLEKYDYAYSYDGSQTKEEEFIGKKNSSKTDTTEYTYDRQGQLLTERNSTLNRQYAYDTRGNRVSMTADGVTTNYTYDKNNRLTQTSTNEETVRYNYDNNGNLYSKLYSRITLATGEAESVGLEVFGQEQATPMSLADGQVELSIEDVSALMEQEPDKSVREILEEYTPTPYAAASKEKTAEFYIYNERGQLTGYTDGTTTASYTYGADGYRKSKTVKGKTTNHIWDGDQIVMETGELRGKYYRAGKEVLSGETTWSLGMCTYMTDGHGNVTQMTVKSVEEFNPTGAYIAKYEYDAYGNQGINWNASDNPFQYCGEYYDEETGMIYLRACYYDPTVGRFISEDPVKDGTNWYAYCNNDPVNAWDPSGMIREGEWRTNSRGERYWTADPDADDYGKDSAKYRILAGLGNLWNKTTEGRKKIHYVATQIRSMAIDNSSYDEAIKQLKMEGILSQKTGELTREICDSVTKDEFVSAYIAYEKVDELMHFDSTMPIEVNVGNYYNFDMICFVEGTKVFSENGLTEIQDIVVGDKVYSKNEFTGEMALKKVSNTFVNYTDELVQIEFEDMLIETTPTHPFWTYEKGWTLAKDLTEKDTVSLFNSQRLQINQVIIKKLAKPKAVYNFEVEDWHTYFVSEVGVWVHNRCLTNKEAAQAAGVLGYSRVPNVLSPGGTWIFTNGKDFITADRSGHGAGQGYLWKMAPSLSNLMGGKYATTDEKLQPIRSK